MDTEGAKKKFDEFHDQIQNLKDILDDYPEEMRPKKTLIFDEILPLSAKLGNGVTYLKDRLRDVLDAHAILSNEDLLQRNAELVKNTQQMLKEKGTKLI